MNCDTKQMMTIRCGSGTLLSKGISALLAAVAGVAWAAMPALAPVGDEGNASDVATGFGAVGYAYRIGVNEVTRADYAAFLNAVAAADTRGLYNPNMGITRTGSPGSYVYAAQDGTRSVAWVSWYDALRYANWLHNGQPSGAAGAAATETGAYAFSGPTSVSARDPAAKVFLPNEDEWYKAAYYQGEAEAWYWGYPTRSDTPPLASAPSGSDNAANYGRVVNAVTAAGAYPASQGYYGTLDQAGNLWEWNETDVSGDRGLRGGSYDDYPLLLHTTYRDSQPPADENEFMGFRIAAAGSQPNRAPVAAAESYSVDEAATLTVAAPGVLANDTDADGDALTVVHAAGTANGTLTLYVDGSFTYAPAGRFAGTDSFSYRPNDGKANGNTVAVTITVRPVFYALAVGSGSGDGSYRFGSAVPIQADPAPAGTVFDRWTGDTALIASVTSASTTLTMQGSAATVTATYKTVTALYALAVGSGSGDGSYAPGTVVSIQADAAPAGMVFDRWTGDTALIANATTASTTLTMTNRAATVTATFKNAPGGQVLTVTAAEWRSRTRILSVLGKGPPRAKITLTDLAGRKIGTCIAKSDGNWKYRTLRSSRKVPGGVRAACKGMTAELNITRK